MKIFRNFSLIVLISAGAANSVEPSLNRYTSMDTQELLDLCNKNDVACGFYIMGVINMFGVGRATGKHDSGGIEFCLPLHGVEVRDLSSTFRTGVLNYTDDLLSQPAPNAILYTMSDRFSC